MVQDISEYIDHLSTLLEEERKAELEFFKKKSSLASLNHKIENGICIYPLSMTGHQFATQRHVHIDLIRTKEDIKNGAFQTGNPVSLFTPDLYGNTRKYCVSGVLHRLQKDSIAVIINKSEIPDWVYGSKLGIELEFDEYTFLEMKRALKSLKDAKDNRLAHLRNAIYKSEIGLEKSSVTIENDSLNNSQQKALNLALNCQEVVIVHGPPGTGKTTTLVETIIEVLNRESQVMVCAPSNAAVDLLTEKLALKGINVLRPGHPARVTKAVLDNTLDAKLAAHPEYKQLKKIRKQAEEYATMASKYKRNFGPAERAQRNRLMQEKKLLFDQADSLEHYMTQSIIQNAQVIACTLIGSSNNMFRNMQFNTIFIDEAAQALEPACWIAMQKAERVIMAGDHCQLPPTVKSLEAARQGLDKTLFQKLSELPHITSMLTMQYRMHDKIMHFSSNYFYKNELESDDSVKERVLFEGDEPFLFIDTAGAGYTDQTDDDTGSTFNDEEANALLQFANQYFNTLQDNKVDTESLRTAIIAPYSAQIRTLNDLADEMSTDHWGDFSINTVDSFQGQERDIVLISLTRSNDKAEIGFLKEIRRINVAMTRAKMKLIIMGDSATFGHHPFYQALLDYAGACGGYKSIFELISY